VNDHESKDYWNRKWGREETGYHEEARKELFAELQPYLRNSVIDLGCGDGMLGKAQGSRYYGIDFSEVAIKRARENCPHGKFEVADIRNTGLPDKAFDTVVLNAILEHFVDFEFVLREARRLAKNWIVVVVSYNCRGAEHYWPAWTVEDMILRLGGLGECIEAKKFKHWVIGVFEA